MSSVASETIADLLSRGISVRFTVSGDSMHPLIREGDALIVDPARPEDVCIGDVVLSLTERGLTAHRVQQIAATGDGCYFTTRGDNAPGTDVPFSASQLLGRVARIDRNGRTSEVTQATGVALTVLRLMERLRLRLSR